MPPTQRVTAERGLLGSLPAVRFDTARRQTRRVGRVPLIEWDGVFYSVPPETTGAIVEVREPVDGGIIEIRHAGVAIATHRLDSDAAYVWDPQHRAATEAAALRRYDHRLTIVADTDDGPVDIPGLDYTDGDYHIDPPDLRLLEPIAPEPAQQPDLSVI